MISYDTEDDSQGNVKILNFFDGKNHTTFRGENARFRAWGHIASIGKEQIWAVNAEYDLVNLFGPWLGKICTLQYVRSGLMRASFKEAKITFLDTLRHWPASVEVMGKTIGLPKLSMPHIGCDCDDCVDYCRRDTEICWLFVSEMLSRYEALGLSSIRSTLPSMALQLFKQFYGKEFSEVDDYCLNAMRKGYYGGRVEIFRMGKISGKINHYDVNSLFPSVMKGGVFPDLDSIYTTVKPDFEREGIFEGWVYIPRYDIPGLPVRAGELLFPYGNVYGSWPYPEIRQLLKDGGRVAKCKEAIEFEQIESPFDKYVDFCYRHRLASKTELDKTFWKLMLNSLYGKFGQNGGLEIIYNDKEQMLEGKAKHANVVWSAYITSYARLRMLGFLRSLSTCFYTDTDSLFTFDNLPSSSDLGALKEEGIYKEAEFKGNKLYHLDDSYKAKGVPRKMAEDFFRTGKATYKKPMRFKEGRARGLQPNVWHEVEKETRKGYTKRRILTDGSTEPWEFGEYQRWMS
jgi:hypothetical protein